MAQQGFDRVADDYDRWYDAPDGRPLFAAELQCLQLLGGGFAGRWLEVGVGTGRFASALGIGEGLDPAFRMLTKAAGRGVRSCCGRAEQLPFAAESFDAVLMVLSLGFLSDPEKALLECFRIVKPSGRLLIGDIAPESSWGRLFDRKKHDKHPLYSMAVFRPPATIIALAHAAGFHLEKTASTLFWQPDAQPETVPRVCKGLIPEAGFFGLLCSKNQIVK
jgi:ubiquinone/menaquinone biosynthesis C-methylase UbiE